MTSHNCLAAILLATLPALAGTALGAPPTDKQVDEAIKAYADATKALKPDQMADRNKAADEAVGKLGVSELTIDQIQKLHDSRIIDMATGLHADTVKRLDELAGKPDATGARAAVMAISFVQSPKGRPTPEEMKSYQKAQADALSRAMLHKGLHDALKAGQAGDVFIVMRQADQPQMDPRVFDAFGANITTDLPPAVAVRTQYFFDFMNEEDAKQPQEKIQQARRLALASTDAAAKDPKIEDRLKTALGKAHKYLDGAYAKNELVGHKAPDFNVLWTNYKEPIKHLSDLKGKVVVLDFWATWCGPCIGSFPKVRDLEDRYKNSPVVILGVTSIQGFHMDYTDPKKAARIDCKNDPKKEMGLMPDFIKQKGMTWSVAFSDEDVFNPEYGVHGIPHVVIIDPAGIVRYRGLHPASDPEGKVHKIDGLLAEFKLPVPPPPTDSTKDEKKEEKKQG